MEPDKTQPVDEAARRLAMGLIRTARFGALATIEPETGAPAASRTSLATLIDGRPVFLISRLSAHFGALEADARASLLIGEPGAGDPLKHARLTLNGTASMLEGAEREAARRRYVDRHPYAAFYEGFADFAYWTLTPERGSLVGGFARAFHLGAADLAAPMAPGLAEAEGEAVAHMNEDHADAVALYAEALLRKRPGDWRLTSLDAAGLDLALEDDVARLWFDRPLTSAAELRPMVVALAKRARR
ncbi:MAG: DUF2470 domain-containing protein [Pseudomonadota bacterium]